MILLKRKRLIIWLLRAYIKKWGKVIALGLIFIIASILLLFTNRNFLINQVKFSSTEKIGIVGDYPEYDFPNNLPEEISSKASRGLTKVLPTGEIAPDIANKWDIKDDGRTFVFYLDDNLTYSNGDPISSESIDYNFADVEIERPGNSVIMFKLKNKYSPFLATVAQKKVFNEDLIGVSNYQIKDVVAEDGFIKSIELVSKKDNKKIKYFFYPTQKALKDAYVLGDVSKIIDISDLSYKDDIAFYNFKNTEIEKDIKKDRITTIFINNLDSTLSDKKIRKALAYSLPDKFDEGERIHVPYEKNSWAFNSEQTYQKSMSSAREFLEDSSASDSGKIELELKVLRTYSEVAEEVAKSWEELGITTNIVIVDSVPRDYQLFLGDMPVLKDPDQYALWHSRSESNITNYENLRIDKLLEDGRQIYDIDSRKEIYDDFQKYLIDDMPAIFLYFPYTYTLNRN